MNVGQVIAEVMKREGVNVLLTYPLNPLTEFAAAADIRPIRHSSIPAKIGLALALAALADFLFYDQRIGLSFTVFAIAIACASVLFNHAALDLRRAVIGGVIVMLGLVPAVEELNPLSLESGLSTSSQGGKKHSGSQQGRGRRRRGPRQ